MAQRLKMGEEKKVSVSFSMEHTLIEAFKNIAGRVIISKKKVVTKSTEREKTRFSNISRELRNLIIERIENESKIGNYTPSPKLWKIINSNKEGKDEE